METAKNSNRQLEQSSVDLIPDFPVLQDYPQNEFDRLIEKPSHQRHDDSDDQGICLSESLSESSSGEELNTGDEDVFGEVISCEIFDLIENLITMALDLRKKVDKGKEFEDGKGELSDDDNTAVALDLTASSARKPPLGPPPPLTPLFPPGPSDSIRHVTAQEKEILRQSYCRLVRFLRLDLPNIQQFTEEYRAMALKRLQSFLFMYLIEVKRKSPAGLNMFQESFGSDLAIRQFFRVFLGKSEQLTRSSSLSGGAVIRPARFASMDDGTPQILCRGPLGHERLVRNSSSNNAPYPLRRGDSGHHPYASGSTTHGHRGTHLSHQSTHSYSSQQQTYPHPPAHLTYTNSSTYQPPQSGHHQQQSSRHPQQPYDNFSRDSLPPFLEVIKFYFIKIIIVIQQHFYV